MKMIGRSHQSKHILNREKNVQISKGSWDFLIVRLGYLVTKMKAKRRQLEKSVFKDNLKVIKTNSHNLKHYIGSVLAPGEAIETYHFQYNNKEKDKHRKKWTKFWERFVSQTKSINYPTNRINIFTCAFFNAVHFSTMPSLNGLFLSRNDM